MSVQKFVQTFGGIGPNYNGSRYKVGEDAVQTYEGGVGYKMDIKDEITNTVMLGLIQNRFYESEEEVLRNCKSTWGAAINRCKEDPSFAEYVAKLISYGREVGGMKFQPVLGLVYLSTLDDKQYFDRAFGHVIKTPKDAHDFVNLCRKAGIRAGVGRHLKTTLANYIAGLSAYHARRYTGKLREVVRIVRPKYSGGEFVKQHTDNLLRYIIKGELTLPEFEALDTVTRKLQDGTVDQEVLRLIDEYDLQLEEIKWAFGNLSKEQLREVYRQMIPGLSIMALMQNLETIAWVFSANDRPSYQERVSGIENLPDCIFLSRDLIRSVAERLRDVEAYKRSRMLPFTPLQASKMTSVPEWKDALLWLVEEGTRTMFDPEKVKNKKIRINVDTSGSMRGMRLTATRNFNAPCLTSDELVGIFGSAIYQALPGDVSIWAIASSYKRVPVRTTRTIQLAQDIMSTDVGMGTNFEQCVTGQVVYNWNDYVLYNHTTIKREFVKEAAYAGENIYILLTDGMQTDNLEGAWAKAKKPKDAKLIIWHINGYNMKVSNRPDVLYLYGYSDKVIEAAKKIIEDGGNMTDIIEQYEI